jgi:hypothetical protein
MLPQTMRNSLVKRDQILQDFVTNNKIARYCDIITLVTILKTVLFVLLYNMFRLLPFNVHDISKTLAEVKFQEGVGGVEGGTAKCANPGNHLVRLFCHPGPRSKNRENSLHQYNMVGGFRNQGFVLYTTFKLNQTLVNILM